MDHKELTRPFDMAKIKWRIGARTKDKSKGIALAYIDARDVMKRLDEVAGWENWQATYPREGTCELSLFVNDRWIVKANCAGETQVEAEKGQASDAFKRAAVLFGIGRYLYYMPNTWHQLENGNLPRNFKPQMPDFCNPANWDEYYPKMFGGK